MKKNTLLILILVNWIGFSCTISSTTPSNKTTMKTNFEVPFEVPKNLKIEIYTEVDKGRPNAGSDKHIGLDGKIYAMGKADYQPFIKKCETILDEKQSAELLNSDLVFLPYFREMKQNISLKTYFESLHDSSLSATLFPKNLNGYAAYPEDERMFFATLLSNPLHPTRIIKVIYADSNTYYVEEMYHRLEIDLPAEVFVTNCDDTFKKGRLMDFVETSPLIQKKVLEGKQEISKQKFNYKDTDLVASYSTSPCLGKCPVFKLEIYGNGKITYTGTAHVEKLGSYQTQTSQEKINLLLQKALDVNYSEVSQKQHQSPTPFVHDGYSIAMKILLDGMSKEVSCGEGHKCKKEILDFQSFFLNLFEEEINGL